MSLEIRVYLFAEQVEDNLCFHAVVNNKEDYDVLVDLNETYEDLMIDALKGEFSLEYVENDTFDKQSYSIDDTGYEANLNKFTEFLQNFYGLSVTLNETSLYAHFGVRLVGASFRGTPDKPMLEHAQYNARNSIHSIKTQLFAPINNNDFVGDDIYIRQEHGSLKIILEATQRHDEPIAFVQKIYADIEERSIDPFQFEDKGQRNRYQTIIKNLNDLNVQKKLKELYVIIDGHELKITQREYLRVESKDIYDEPITLSGVLDSSYKPRTKTFELYVEGIGKYSCHLSSLETYDLSQFEEVYEKLKDLIVMNNIKLKIIGKKKKPKTINIEDVEIIT